MTNSPRRDALDRRTVLKMAAVGATIPALAGCSSSDDTDESETAAGDATESGDAGGSDFDGWFDDVSNYDGVTDESGSDQVTVAVGAEGNGGGFGFDPAAVRVDSGTTVVWEWVGGSHNVVAEDGSFGSEMSSESGYTFEHTFEESGTYKYVCEPHERMGMKGAVVVE